MKINMILIKVLFFLILTSTINTQGLYPILNMPYSARSISLSESGTSNAFYSISYNPASIKVDKILFGFHSILLPLNISYNRLEFIYSIGNNTYYTEIKNIDYGTFYDDLLNTQFRAQEIALKFGTKRPFYNTFSGSLSIDYIYSYIANYVSQGLAVSAGIRAETISGRNGFSLSLENSGMIFDRYNQSNEGINSNYRFSTYHKLLYAPANLNFDITHDSYNNSHLSSSIEIKIKSIIILRLGIGSINLEKNINQNNYQYSFGFGINYNNYILDYGVKNIKNIGLSSGLSIHYIMP